MMHENGDALAAVWGLLVPVVALAAVLLCFLTALSNLEQGRMTRESASWRRPCAAPLWLLRRRGDLSPDLAYLEERYGLQIDTDRYTVYCDVFASNLMPDITVLENEP